MAEKTAIGLVNGVLPLGYRRYRSETGNGGKRERKVSAAETIRVPRLHQEHESASSRPQMPSGH